MADWASSATGSAAGEPERRRELLRIVREELLDSRGGVIVDSAWLRLLQQGSPHRRLGLLYGRLWQSRPLVLRSLEALVHPALELADRPLAPHDADLIDGQAWDRFLLSVLRPGVPHEAFVKTRSTVQGALRDVGVLEIAGGRDRSIRVRRGRPDPLAYSWVLARQLAELGEQAEGWALRDAFAARLFAPRPDYAPSASTPVTAGSLRRGHLMAQSRLQVGSEMS